MTVCGLREVTHTVFKGRSLLWDYSIVFADTVGVGTFLCVLKNGCRTRRVKG